MSNIMNTRTSVAALAAALLSWTPSFATEAAGGQRGFEELRNTVINLLQGLVERGVISREQAAQMVKDAQAKAEADTDKAVAQARAEEGAVRVPFVPEIVKQEIRRQVAADLGKEVTGNVIDAAKSEGQ